VTFSFRRCSLLLFTAVWWSKDSQYSHSAGSGSSADDSRRRTLTDGGDRQETRLQVGLGDAGSISVQPRRPGDVAASSRALDVLPDGTDAACVVELRACVSCWIELTATIERFDEQKVADVEDDRSPITGNNANNTCRLWLVWFSHRNAIDA